MTRADLVKRLEADAADYYVWYDGQKDEYFARLRSKCANGEVPMGHNPDRRFYFLGSFSWTPTTNAVSIGVWIDDAVRFVNGQ